MLNINLVGGLSVGTMTFPSNTFFKTFQIIILVYLLVKSKEPKELES